MRQLDDELLEEVLKWQSKRYILLLSAIDSTNRLKGLVLSSDEEAIDLELDVRESILDELKVFDEEFKVLTVDLEEEDIQTLLSKDDEAKNLSPLEKTLRKANRSSSDASYILIISDKEFRSFFKGKEVPKS